jgi:hypothetical protein
MAYAGGREPVAQHVDVAVAQRPVGVEGFDFVEPDLAAGVAGLKDGDEPAERWPLGGEHESHPQQPADRGGQLAGVGQGLVHRGQRGGEAALEFFAGRGEPDPAAGPVEELDSEPGLQGPDGLADRRLGDTQPLGGAAEMQFTGESDEDPQLA